MERQLAQALRCPGVYAIVSARVYPEQEDQVRLEFGLAIRAGDVSEVLRMPTDDVALAESPSTHWGEDFTIRRGRVAGTLPERAQRSCTSLPPREPTRIPAGKQDPYRRPNVGDENFGLAESRSNCLRPTSRDVSLQHDGQDHSQRGAEAPCNDPRK